MVQVAPMPQIAPMSPAAPLAPPAEAPGRIAKRPGAFRTISEVAEDLGLAPHVLRFWEARFAQIRPTKRAGGRRYYRPEDVDLIAGIRRLLHGQGYTIRGAQRVLKENGVRFVQAVGRGEAEPTLPPPGERATEGEGLGEGAPDEATALDGPTGSPGRRPGRPLEMSGQDAAEREIALRGVLRDLLTCRAALAGLRAGETGET